jgi:hypothetical protein
MERFVIGAAIFAAVAIAAGGYFGHAISDGEGSFSFEIDGESRGGSAKGTGAPSTVPAARFNGSELQIRNAVAVLKVIPEDRTDFAVEIVNPGVLATPTVKVDGGDVIVDGGISHRRASCRTEAGAKMFQVSGVGAVALAQAPTITVRAPRDLKVSIGGAVDSDIGASTSAELSFSGCGDSKIGDVAGALEIDASGSGDIAAGAARSAKISVAGSGDATVGAIGGALEVDLAGSGGVTAASAAGPLEISIAGSGGVTVASGAMGDAEVSIAGSGDVSLVGDVQRLEVSIAGSGDVDVRGKAASVDASIMGSGDVTVAEVSGGVQKSVMGSGNVQIGKP